MVSKGSDHAVLWPRYFDRSVSRAQGRRVPESLAVKAPDADWILAAAKKLNMAPILEEGARDPAKPYQVAGRVLVKVNSKESAIKQVAERMRASQDERAEAPAKGGKRRR